MLAAAADELASYASMAAAACLWAQPEAPADSAAQGQAARRAQLALGCLCLGLQLLACQPGVLAQGGTAPAGCRLAAGCLQALQGFVEAQQAQQATAAAAWDAARWQNAAAQLLPLAECCSALWAAAEAGWLHDHSLAAAAAAASESLSHLLQLQLAASDAAAAAQAQGKAATAGGTAGALAAYSHRLCWKAAHALVIFLQRLPSGQPGHAGSCAGQPAPQEQLGHWEERQAFVLAAALASLERAAVLPALASDARGLLFQLRCCRLVLPAALADARVARQVLARRQQGQGARQLQQQAAAPGGSTGDELAAAQGGDAQADLAAWLCQVAWQAYEGAALLPCLDPVAAQASTCARRSVALHR